MQVLHINQSDITGGAAIAVHRLHQGLLAQGIDSRLLVDIVTTSSDRVAAIPPRRRLDYQIRRLTKHLGFNDIHLTSTFEIAKHPFYQAADVLHFHNLHSGYFNYLALPSLTKNKPAILTLHDMWGITGHCAYSFDCDRWKIGCGNCPYPDTYPPIQRDNTYLEWKLKHWAYSHSHLVAVATTSHWLAEQAKQSMLGRLPVHHIPYSIDTQAYQPLDPELCRSLLGITRGKKVLMFGAQSLTNPRKGGDLLLKALSGLPDSLKSEIVLLIMGNRGEKMVESLGIPSLNLGFVGSDRLKAIAYSAADLFLFPTRADAFGLVAQEAMACATPVVSFKVGGVPDIVRPGITGYLAQPEDASDFSAGIMQLLEDQALRDRLGQQSREIILEEYALEVQAQRYLQLYGKVLDS
ncbi:glycosyl transferase, group 1 family protein [Coleofasciculus chthonoplastes PCC 7420]|uniref:Glycosyl transferase, group 1 family protein n=1 Tax=Coleofasciculus chthonoplastes PCC 7420 TaxID=118168 RepID=B4VH90_9CYAN|nr:glycosyltransferase family 4 protein [Coleofasciculus chthonoplastes]EDX78627.1 glycosyl transferase, group 1 family protein [Coleofasciculus chthonoplastes PCC 7420]